MRVTTLYSAVAISLDMVRIPLKRSTEKIYEYACHEGNIAMGGILAGARVQERK